MALEAYLLEDLLQALEETPQVIFDNADALQHIEITEIEHDSRKVKPGTLFFCITGFESDGHAFAAAAIQAGAVALMVEHPVTSVSEAVPQIVVKDTREALARLAGQFYGSPDAQISLIGITGTNGKTTSAFLTEHILRTAGKTTGLMGTIETKIAGMMEPSARTTPDALELIRLLARMRGAGVTHAVMEVSSHALDLRRVSGLHFAAVAFTNLSQDHLDYHHDMESYYAVKKRLFTEYEAGARIVNVDDAWGKRLSFELQATGRAVSCVSEHPELQADAPFVSAADVHLDAQATRFVLCSGTNTAQITLPLIGAYNLNNALVAAACALAVGIPFSAVAAALKTAPQVPGRLEHVSIGQDFAVIVDYAHTDDALHTALSALRAITFGRLITVFGCGGDRDRSKRPLMGRAAGELSDKVFVTSDNPRTEDPTAILQDILPGLEGTGVAYKVVVDRNDAINRAIDAAQSGDCVFIAGKGHEDYQIFADRTIHFDDREVARGALLRRQAGSR